MIEREEEVASSAAEDRGTSPGGGGSETTPAPLVGSCPESDSRHAAHGTPAAHRLEADVTAEIVLPPIPAPLKVAHDYAATGLSLRAHPMSFIRADLNSLGVTPAGELRDETKWPNGKKIAMAGVVLVRQRPGTASGIVFFTLEDETGVSNLIVRPHIYDRYRRAARHSVAIMVRGTIERQGAVVHILVTRIETLDHVLRELDAVSRDFH